MILKFVTSVLSPNGEGSSSPLQTVELVRKAIRAEVLGLAFKILFAVTIVAIIIFSIVQVGDAAKIILAQMQDGPTIQLLVFGLVAMTGLLLLYFLLRGADGFRLSSKAPPTLQGSIDYQGVALKFVEGFLKGLERGKPPEDPHS